MLENDMSKILAVEYLGFPTVALTVALTKYWFSYFGHYEAQDFQDAFRWTVRRNPSGFPPTPGLVMTELANTPPKQRQLPEPIFIPRKPVNAPKSDVDIVFDYWGGTEYRRMLLELLHEIAPGVEIDPTKASSVVKLCYVKGWAPKYRQWLKEQIEMIKNLEAHPV